MWKVVSSEMFDVVCRLLDMGSGTCDVERFWQAEGW